MNEANAEVTRWHLADIPMRKTSGGLVRIGSKETGRDGTEIETDAESCMPGNANDASYVWLWRLRREETESERGLHEEPRYNKERDRERHCGDERRP